jgi:hypothetical protein
VRLGTGWPPLDGFAAALRAELGAAADISHQALTEVITLTEVRPNRRGALRVAWIVLADSEVILQAGEIGGRWELEQTEEDLSFLRRLTMSVIAGRVTETFGAGRSLVEVTLEDGHVESASTHNLFEAPFPQPGWRLRGRRVQYAPYR